MIKNTCTTYGDERPTLTLEELKSFINKHFQHDAHVKTYLKHKSRFSYWKTTFFTPRPYQQFPINPLVNF
jgi:hypothetical protein